jgi:hypothetical protein
VFGKEKADEINGIFQSPKFSKLSFTAFALYDEFEKLKMEQSGT